MTPSVPQAGLAPSVSQRLKLAYQLGRHLGPDWLIYRMGYALRNKSGWLRRRLPARPWTAAPLAGLLREGMPSEPDAYLAYRRTQAPPFLFSPADRSVFQGFFARWSTGDAALAARGEGLAAGSLTYFSGLTLETGFPPNWHRNALSGETAPADAHWTDLDEYAYGDIKVIWEPSRFGFAYDLVRLYWRTGDEKWPELFWQAVASWRQANPPQLGPNWRCGQETAFRVMAWCFGLYGFLESPATTAQRVVDLAQMVAVSGERIEANLGYALSQRNNHSLSEPVGLWTIGLLFPELDASTRWLRLGRRTLEAQTARLFYADGAFSQHSFNYERVGLQDLLWALALGERNHQPLDRSVYETVGRAATFLYALSDAGTGWLPRYGHDDGALILPLSHCAYDDFRPAIQAAHFYGCDSRCYGDGPWDEDLLWLQGPEALRSPANSLAQTDLDAAAGGYYALRTGDGMAFMRCPQQFRHRPSQADLLHVDIGWRGLDIAIDPGTFSYNAAAPWDTIPLAATAYHNTVTVDEREQMDRRGRYLWLPWPHGDTAVRLRAQHGTLAYWEGGHDGYTRLPAPVHHRRGVLHLGDEQWLVIDHLTSTASHRYRLHWLFAAWPYTWQADAAHLMLRTSAGDYHVRVCAGGADAAVSLVRAAEDSPRGWYSPRYWVREPALSLAYAVEASSVRLMSCLGPEACTVTDAPEGGLQVVGARWTAVVRWSGADGGPLVASVSRQGEGAETLVIHERPYSI